MRRARPALYEAILEQVGQAQRLQQNFQARHRRLVFRFNRHPNDDSWRPGGIVSITVYDLDQEHTILSNTAFRDAAEAVAALPRLEANFGLNCSFFYCLGDGAFSSIRTSVTLLILSGWLPDGAAVPPPYPLVAGRVDTPFVPSGVPHVPAAKEPPLKQLSAGRRVIRKSDLEQEKEES